MEGAAGGDQPCAAAGGAAAMVFGKVVLGAGQADPVRVTLRTHPEKHVGSSSECSAGLCVALPYWPASTHDHACTTALCRCS